MKMSYLLSALVLLGLAAFFLVRGGRLLPESGENTEEKKRNTRSVTRSSSSDRTEGSRRLVKSDRILREKAEVAMTESGLIYEVLVQGDGRRPGPTSKVKVHYVGTFEDGKVFDSSREHGQQPLELPLNAVIKGWAEGLQIMREGAQYRFEIPPELAYGDSGTGGRIPPGSTLIFDVELIEVVEE